MVAPTDDWGELDRERGERHMRMLAEIRDLREALGEIMREADKWEQGPERKKYELLFGLQTVRELARKALGE